MALTPNGTQNTSWSPFGYSVDTSAQYDAMNAGDDGLAQQIAQQQQASLAADQAAATAPPLSPPSQTMPLATQPGASIDPVNPRTPSPTPSAGQGGESFMPAPLSTPDPMAFATSPGLGLSMPAAPTTQPAPATPAAPSGTDYQGIQLATAGQPYANAIQGAATARDAANDAAHMTAPGTQTTDPYGHTASVDGSTSSNTYDAALEALHNAGINETDPNFLQEKAQFWGTVDPSAAATVTWGGQVQSPEAVQSLLGQVTPEQATQYQQAWSAAQTPSDQAVANGFIDPAITAQYFDANGFPLSLLPPSMGGTAPATGAPTGATTGAGTGAGWEAPISGTGSVAAPAPSPSTPTAPTPTVPPPVTAPAPTAGTAAPATPAVPAPLSASPTLPVAGASPLAPTTAVPTGNSTTSASPISTSSTAAPYANLQQTTPTNSLTNQTILPGSATDRTALAQHELELFDQQQQPYFQRDLRSASLNAASRGQLGSGALNSSLGDVVNQYNLNRSTKAGQFMDAAQTGSIDDAYKNLGLLTQQQQFQAGQQQQAFGQNVQLQQLADSEDGQKWTQYMQTMGFNANQIQQAFTNAFQTQQLQNSQAVQQWTEQMQAAGFNAQQIQQAFQNNVGLQQLSDSENQQSFWQALQQSVQGNSGNPTDIYQWLSQLYALPQNYSTATA